MRDPWLDVLIVIATWGLLIGGVIVLMANELARPLTSGWGLAGVLLLAVGLVSLVGCLVVAAVRNPASPR